MILSCNYSRLEDFDLWKVVLKAVPLFMYPNIVKFCSLIPNWTFVGPVAEVCFAGQNRHCSDGFECPVFAQSCSAP